MSRGRAFEVGAVALLCCSFVVLFLAAERMPAEVSGALAGLAVLVLLPVRWLPSLAVVVWSLSRLVDVLGQWPLEMMLAEVVLLVWLARVLPGVLSRPLAMRWSTAALLGLSLWLMLTTALAGSSVGPLAHFLVLATILWALESGAPCDRRFFGWTLVAVTALETAMSFQGVGVRLYGADPAQLGFVAIAASLMLPRLRHRWLWWVLQFGLAAVILMTQTRSVYFAFAVVTILRLLPRVRQSAAYAVILGGLALGVLAVGPLTALMGLRENSSALRLASLQGGLEVATSNPLLGVGWADKDASNALYNAGFTTMKFGVYNLYLGLVVAGGLAALLLFAAFIVPKLRDASRFDKPVMLVGVAFLAQGMSEMVFYPGSLILPVLFISLGIMKARGEPSADVGGPEQQRAGVPGGVRGPRKADSARRGLGGPPLKVSKDLIG